MEKQFDKDLQEISDNYEAAKDAFVGYNYALTTNDRYVAASKFYNAIKRLRDIACMGLKSKEQQSEN